MCDPPLLGLEVFVFGFGGMARDFGRVVPFTRAALFAGCVIFDLPVNKAPWGPF